MQLFLFGAITTLIPSVLIVAWLAWKEDLFAERPPHARQRMQVERPNPTDFDFRELISEGNRR